MTKSKGKEKEIKEFLILKPLDVTPENMVVTYCRSCIFQNKHLNPEPEQTQKTTE